MGKRRDESHFPPARADDDPRGELSALHARLDRCMQHAQWHETAERVLGFATLTWEPGYDRMTWSDGLYALLGHDQARIAPNFQDFIAAFHPEDRTALLVRLETALDSGAGFSLYARVGRGCETQRVRMVAEITPSTGRNLNRMDALLQREPSLVRKTDEGKPATQNGCETEQSTRLENERIRAIIDAATDAIFAFDGECRYTLWNKAAERLSGKLAGEVIGTSAFELFPFLVELGVDVFYLRALAGERSSRMGWHLTAPEQGLDRYYDVVFSPLREMGGAVIGGVGVLHDVTAQKRAEESLRLREQEFRTLAESVPDVITRFDRNLRPLYVNRAGERHVGESPEGFIRERGAEMILPREQRSLWEKVLPRVFESGEPAVLEFFVPTAAGPRIFETRVVPEAADGGPVQTVITLSRDITDRKRAEDELHLANRQLTHAMNELRASQRQFIQAEKLSALGTLAAGIAHELNNPMMGVMNYVDYARGIVSDPAARDTLTRAAHELERMRDLLKSMLAFTRPMDEPVREFTLDAVVHSALALMAPEFRTLGIEVVTELAPDLPRLMAKERQLQQVFVNVLMNARDALEASQTKRVHIRAVPDGDNVRVDITDTGPGIPAEIQDKIFDPFFTTKPPGRGTGLGLSISRTIMLDLGGDMSYRRPEEGGTTISVVVPSASPTGGSHS